MSSLPSTTSPRAGGVSISRPHTRRSGYGRPLLVEFGRISRRTLGGSGTQMETMGGQTMRFP